MNDGDMLMESFVNGRMKPVFKQNTDPIGNMFQLKGTGIVDCQSLNNEFQMRFMMPWESKRPHCEAVCDVVHIHFGPGFPAFGYSGPVSTNGFSKTINHTNDESLKHHWTLIVYVGQFLQAISSFNQTAVVHEKPTGIVPNWIVEKMDDLNRRRGLEMQLSLLFMSLGNGRQHLLCNPYPSHWSVPDTCSSFLMHCLRDLDLKTTMEAQGIQTLGWLMSLNTQLEFESIKERGHGDFIVTFNVVTGKESDLTAIRVFHGTKGENLHSILQNGLRILTDTRLMKNGDAFGHGIYTSDTWKVAEEFALSNNYKRHFWHSQRFPGDSKYKLECFNSAFIVECDLNIDDPESFQVIGNSSKYFVVNKSDSLIIRKLHVLLVQSPSFQFQKYVFMAGGLLVAAFLQYFISFGLISIEHT